jgi:hypothetical protein
MVHRRNSLVLALTVALASFTLGAPQHDRSRTPPGSPPELLTGATVKRPAALVREDVGQPDRPSLPLPRPAPASLETKALPDAATSRRGVDHSRMLYELTPASVPGSIVARGAEYKAEFGPSGATFVPFFGSAAPRNFPLTFAIDSVSIDGVEVAFESRAPAIRSGDEVRFERGSLTELYQLAPASMEQQFVFPSLPRGGDLRIRLGVTGDFEPRECSDALEFAAGLGSVRYGVATAIDAAGAVVPATTRLVESGIEIVVPAAFLAFARFPLTVDPVISTFTLPGSGSSTDDFLPDVAYDPGTDHFLAVYEEAYSASDHDVLVSVLDGTGGLLATGYVDASSGYWATPRVANNKSAGEFLVVARLGDPALTISAIFGVRFGATFPYPLYGPYQISSYGDGDAILPDVGGDPFPGVTYYCVTWEREYSASDHDILAQFVRTDGTNLYGSSVLIDNSGGTMDQRPSISKSNQSTGIWHIAWQRQVTSTNHDIFAAETRYNGTVLTSSTPVDTNSNWDSRAPHASSHLETSGHWALSYEDAPGAGPVATIHVRTMNGASTVAQAYLDWWEFFHGWETGTESYASPCVETDGSSFVLGYAVSYNGSSTDYDVYTVTMQEVGSSSAIRLSQSRSNLAFSTSHEDHVRLVAGAGQRYLAVWDDDTHIVTAHDIEAGIYASDDYVPFCLEYTDAPQCPCGNHPQWDGGCDNFTAYSGGALLVGNGYAHLGADNLAFTVTGENPTVLTIFLQGTTTANTLFGAGTRCVGGTLKRLYVKNAAGGACAAPAGGELPVHQRSAALGDVISPGQLRYYMTFYRDPNAAGFCGQTFNGSQALQVLWRP